MPFKSQAQRAKFYVLHSEGKISSKELNEWEAATPKNKPLPKRIGPKKPAKKMRHGAY